MTAEYYSCQCFGDEIYVFVPGKSLEESRKMYIELIDTVFQCDDVKIPSEQLVKLLKQKFGRDVKLTDDEMVQNSPK